MQSLRRLMSHYLRAYLKESILATVLLVGVVMADLSIPRLAQRIIDDGIANQNMPLIINTALIMIGVSFLSAILAIGNTILAVRVSQSLGADLRSDLVRKIQTFSFGNLDRLSTGQLLVRTTSDVNQIQMVALEFLRLIIRLPMWMLGSIGMLILISQQLALLMTVLVPIVAIIIWVFTAYSQRLFLVVQKRLDRLNQVMQENLAGVRLVKAFVRVAHEKARFEQANVDVMTQTISVMMFLTVLIPVLLLTINLGIAGVVWFGGIQVIEGTLKIGALVAAVNYLLSSMVPMLIFGRVVGPLAAAGASSERVFEVLDSAADVQNVPQPQPLTAPTGRIEFKDVNFSYNEFGHEPVLKNVNLVAEPGETVAVLGGTGSGKSTLIHLIPRFYDVTAGQITLDGRDVREIPLAQLRGQVGIALQEAVLFSGTIRENIRYGMPETSDEAVIEAAKAAQAHDFISGLPDGYDTIVGQRGVTLSGGQKQRISIARALLVQPQILILDDSTSAVDVETEGKIQDALSQLRESGQQNPTSFVIAQRISTVLAADKIVVMDRGAVAAIGTHQTLMNESAIYQEIYESQLGGGLNGQTLKVPRASLNSKSDANGGPHHG